MTLIIAGAAGGFVKSLLESDGRVLLPKLEKTTDGNTYIYFGFLLTVILGAVASLATNDPLAAITAGMSVAFVGESLLEKVQPAAKVQPK